MCKKIFPILFFAIHAASAHSMSLFKNDSLTFSGTVGYTHFNTPRDQIIIISPYVTNLLTGTKQRDNASYGFSMKQQLNIRDNIFNKIMLGPAIYFQNVHHSGEVWEMLSPEFYNYQYNVKSNNMNALVEGEFHLNPIVARLVPFFTLGVGFSVVNTRYDDYALPGIPADSTLHSSSSQTKAMYELGAGLALPLSKHWTVNARYAYFHLGHVAFPLTQFQPLSRNLNSQNVFFGINYSV